MLKRAPFNFITALRSSLDILLGAKARVATNRAIGNLSERQDCYPLPSHRNHMYSLLKVLRTKADRHYYYNLIFLHGLVRYPLCLKRRLLLQRCITYSSV